MKITHLFIVGFLIVSALAMLLRVGVEEEKPRHVICTDRTTGEEIYNGKFTSMFNDEGVTSIVTPTGWVEFENAQCRIINTLETR